MNEIKLLVNRIVKMLSASETDLFGAKKHRAASVYLLERTGILAAVAILLLLHFPGLQDQGQGAEDTLYLWAGSMAVLWAFTGVLLLHTIQKRDNRVYRIRSMDLILSIGPFVGQMPLVAIYFGLFLSDPFFLLYGIWRGNAWVLIRITVCQALNLIIAASFFAMSFYRGIAHVIILEQARFFFRRKMEKRTTVHVLLEDMVAHMSFDNEEEIKTLQDIFYQIFSDRKLKDLENSKVRTYLATITEMILRANRSKRDKIIAFLGDLFCETKGNREHGLYISAQKGILTGLMRENIENSYRICPRLISRVVESDASDGIRRELICWCFFHVMHNWDDVLIDSSTEFRWMIIQNVYQQYLNLVGEPCLILENEAEGQAGMEAEIRSMLFRLCEECEEDEEYSPEEVRELRMSAIGFSNLLTSGMKMDYSYGY